MIKKIIFFILIILLAIWYSNKNINNNVLPKYSEYEEKINEGIEEVNRITLFQTKKEPNKDIIGTIKINNVINETIVQGKDNIEYVRKAIDGSYDAKGVPFLDYRVTDKSQNKIIYGHSSKKSPIIFTNLMQYLDYEFCINNPHVHLIQNDYDKLYKIISVYTININEYYDQAPFTTDFENDIFFQKAVLDVMENSIHHFEHEASETKELLTLVTCNTQNSDERLLVIASLVS